MPATQRNVPDDLEAEVFAARIGDGDVLERESAGFDLQMRGYSRDQVEQRIAEWATAYDAVELERDHLLREVQELRGRPQQLTPLESMSARIAAVVGEAEAEATALRESVRREADALLADAQETARADREAAAAERSVAAGEAQRWVTEGKEHAKTLVDEAQEEAERLRGESTAEAQSIVGRANQEAAQTRAVVATEQEQILAGARAEAAELERTTVRRKDIAEAEHQRLLEAHANHQKQYASGLRAELAELQSRRDEAEAELTRLRQLLSVPTPSRTPTEALTGGPFAADALTIVPAAPAPAAPVRPEAAKSDAAADPTFRLGDDLSLFDEAPTTAETFVGDPGTGAGGGRDEQG